MFFSQIRFDWPEKGDAKMTTTSTEMNKINSVSFMNDSLGLHQMKNPSSFDAAVSLHVYSPPFNRCKVFDMEGNEATGHINFFIKTN